MLFLDHLSARVKPNIRIKFWEDHAIEVGVDKYILWMWTVASQFTPYPDHRFAMARAAENLEDYYLLKVMRQYCVREDASSMERLATECFEDHQRYRSVHEFVLLRHLVNQAQGWKQNWQMRYVMVLPLQETLVRADLLSDIYACLNALNWSGLHAYSSELIFAMPCPAQIGANLWLIFNALHTGVEGPGSCSSPFGHPFWGQPVLKPKFISVWILKYT